MMEIIEFLNSPHLNKFYCGTLAESQFYLTTCDSYFTILTEVFTNCFLKENTNFTNQLQ